MNKHESVEPTQGQLRQLRGTVETYEPDVPLFEGIPPGIDLTKFVQFTAPHTYDENNAPAAILQAPDRRVIWLSIFRNPDNRKIVRTSILILDPEINRPARPELPEEDYIITENALGNLAITQTNTAFVTTSQVAALQEFIDASEQVNPFPD